MPPPSGAVGGGGGGGGGCGRLPLVLLAFVVAALAFVAVEPLLPLPTFFATLAQRGLWCPPRWSETAALALAVGGTTLAALRAGAIVWPPAP